MPEKIPIVYVVDDDRSVGRALSRVLRSVGLEAAVFTSAGDYLAAAAPVHPACLVMDVRMPGLSGVELQARIAGTDKALPVIVITGHADEEIRQQALKAGAVAFLYKPIADKALLDAVGRALALDEKQRAKE